MRTRYLPKNAIGCESHSVRRLYSAAIPTCSAVAAVLIGEQALGTHTHGAGSRGGALLLGLALAACGPAPESSPPVAPGDWRSFDGIWNAAGSRHTLSLGGDRVGSIIDLKDSLLLAGPGRPGVGFQSEVIGLVDSATGFTGRSVWTDEHGDQVFSELAGQGTAEANRITGTILSGTGRYAGATGTYEFSWQRLMEDEEGNFQGRAVDLKGRVRAAAGREGAPR